MSYRDDPDVRLMLAFQDGDGSAFDALFRKYSGPIVGYIYRYFGSRDVAEELGQEVFLKVHRYAGDYRPKASFSVWLYKIATNICMNELRKGEYKQRIESMDNPIRSDDGEISRELPDPAAQGADVLVEGRRLEALVSRILDGLPEKQRAAFILSRFQGMRYQEIAGCLECSVGAVKSLVHRAAEAVKTGVGPLLAA